ncbi:MAG: hypothetical protein JEZ14_13630 [Marinilabiliaceae bacterium]|nr:hypothetical protein [Marinilabiliaceae bacterium]
MEKDILDKFVDTIKEEVEKKYGKKIAYAKDCMILSEEIITTTNRQISITTLKRFFGIINSPFNPSKYTLDTLSLFVGFKSWREFINSFEQEKHHYSSDDSWEQLKQRTNLVTEYSLQSMKAKCGDQLKTLPLRLFAVQKMESFLENDRPATAFIAPEGYGKTVMLIQLVNHFFMAHNALYPKDIVCLIDGRILVKLLTLDLEKNRISNLLEFDTKNSMGNYFKQHPSAVKGRFILFIDGINEIYHQPEKRNQFIDNLLKIITAYENIPWFKLIITCHPDTWYIFQYHIKRNPYLKRFFFDVPFEGSYSETINIPLLQTTEIKTSLHQHKFAQSFESLQFHYPGLLDIIRHPYFLYLFLNTPKAKTIRTDIELLYEFSNDKLLSNPLAPNKINLINQFLSLCNNGKERVFVDKNELVTQPEESNAYDALVKDGILHEYKVPGSYLSISTYVEFTHALLLEFFLANHWLKEQELSTERLKTILHFYDENLLQCKTLKFIIKVAFKEEKINVLKDIYSIFTLDKEKGKVLPLTGSFQEILTIITLELRKNKRIREELVPWFAKSKEAQRLYFEHFFDMDCLVLYTGDHMDYYLQNNPSEKAQIYGHFIKYMQYFLAADPEKCEAEYAYISQLKHSDKYLGFYYCALLIHQITNKNKSPQTLLTQINNYAQSLLKSGCQSAGSIPLFELSIISALNYGDCFREIIKLSDYLQQTYLLERFEVAAIYQLFRAIYARALLNTNQPEEANAIFKTIHFQYIPVTIRQYILIRYKLIEIEFLIHSQQAKRAHELINEVKSASKMLRFYYFYQRAENLFAILDRL